MRKIPARPDAPQLEQGEGGQRQLHLAAWYQRAVPQVSEWPGVLNTK